MAGTSWPALVAGARARAADVELKFDWIEGNIVPMSGGSATDAAYDLGTTASRWRHGYLSGRLNVPAIGLSDTSFLSFDATGTITANKPVKMTNGVAIDEFSSDVTLAGNSDLAVPTERAVKTYVDSNVLNIGVAIATSTTAVTQLGSTAGASNITGPLSFTSQGLAYVLVFSAQYTLNLGTIGTSIFSGEFEIVRDDTSAAGFSTPIKQGYFAHSAPNTSTARDFTRITVNHVAYASLTSGAQTFRVRALGPGSDFTLEGYTFAVMKL